MFTVVEKIKNFPWRLLKFVKSLYGRRFVHYSPNGLRGGWAKCGIDWAERITGDPKKVKCKKCSDKMDEFDLREKFDRISG